MSWLWAAAEQAASGDFEGAWNTASEGAQETAEEITGAVGAAIDEAAEAVGLGGGSSSGAKSGGSDGGIVGRIFGALDDASGGHLSEAVYQWGTAVGAAAEGDFAGAIEHGSNAAGSAFAAAGTAANSTGLTPGHLAEAAGRTYDEAMDSVEKVVTVTGDAVARGADALDEATGRVVSGHIESTYETLDEASGGKLSETIDHAREATKAVFERDVEGVIEHGADAAGSAFAGAATAVNSTGLTPGHLAEAAGRTYDEAMESVEKVVTGTGDAVARGADALDEATGRVVSGTAERVYEGVDEATGGKLTETVDHAREATKAVFERDVEGVIEHGADAVGSTVEGAGNVAAGTASAIRTGAENVASDVREGITDLDEATGGHVSTTLDRLEEGIDRITGGNLTAGAEHAGAAVRAVAEGDFAGAAEEGKAAADAFGRAAETVVERVFDEADQLTGGHLGAAREGFVAAAERAGAGDFEGAAEAAGGALASLGQAGETVVDTGLDRLRERSRSLGEEVRTLVDEASDDAAQLATSAEEAAAGLVTETFDAVDAAANGRLGAARDRLTTAAERAVAGDHEGALDAATSAHDELVGAAAELAENGVALLTDADTPAPAADSVEELLDRAAERTAEAADDADEDPEAAAEAADEAAAAYTEVTARLGAATAVTLDDATGGALGRTAASVERARAELASGRYDDALAELDRTAGELDRVPSVLRTRAAIEVPTQGTEPPAADDIRAEGHVRLGAIVDAVVRRAPVADPEPSDHGEASASVEAPHVESLSGGHLARAAASIRRAATTPDDADSRGRAALVEEADSHLRQVGPAVATSVVAAVDVDGHLGDTVGLASRTAGALRTGHYEDAATLAPRVTEQVTRSVEGTTRHVEDHDPALDTAPTADDVPGEDLTDGHADAAIGYLETALAHEERGETEEALQETTAAAEEYEAAMVSYDRNVERAVERLVGTDAPPPVRAAAVSALDTCAGGALGQARSALERGANNARSGEVARSLEEGHQARVALGDARTAYSRPEIVDRVTAELRTALAEADGDTLSAEEFGRGAPHDDAIDDAIDDPVDDATDHEAAETDAEAGYDDQGYDDGYEVVAVEPGTLAVVAVGEWDAGIGGTEETPDPDEPLEVE